MKLQPHYLKTVAWAVTIFAWLLALIVWVQSLNGRFWPISNYQLFPLLGLLAFGTMWAHYIMSALRQLAGLAKVTLKSYFDTTSWIALIAIVLHPGLLVWQLWQDGFGFPPGSVLESYVAPAMRGAVSLGTVSLLAFLAYELRRFSLKQSWWGWTQYASDIAMIAILYHGWVLGTHLQSGWYRGVWIFYGMSLFIALGYSYYRRLKRPRVAEQQ